MKHNGWTSALLLAAAGAFLTSAAAQKKAPAAVVAEPPPAIVLPVGMMSGAVYPSMRPAVQIRVFLNAAAVLDEV
jgi:hypothetical protein